MLRKSGKIKKKLSKPVPIAKELLLKSRKKARQITSQFHKLNNELESLQKKERVERDKYINVSNTITLAKDDGSDNNSDRKEKEISSQMEIKEVISKREGIENKLRELGGRSLYQRASILSVSFHNTNKWVLSRLGEFFRQKKYKFVNPNAALLSAASESYFDSSNCSTSSASSTAKQLKQQKKRPHPKLLLVWAC